MQLQHSGMVFLILDDAALTIAPSSPEIEAELTYEYKQLLKDPKKPWMKRAVRTSKEIFRRVDNSGIRAITTHQGMWWRIKQFCKERGIPTRLVDRRFEFPRPRFDLMFGFRCQQESLLRQFLSMNCSGCLKAPTRYGKTGLMINTLRALSGVMTVVTCPGTDLLEQSMEDFKKALPHREIVQIGGGSRTEYPSDDITVCSMDSLDKCDFNHTRLLMVDEPHSLMTDNRLPMVLKYKTARRLGFGATLEGRYDNRDLVLEAVLGPTLVERTFRAAVEEGAVCPLVVLMLKVKIDGTLTARSRDGIYKQLLYENQHMGHLIKDISDRVVPENWQQLIFIDNEPQAEMLGIILNDPKTPIAMAKRMKKGERTELRENMRAGDVRRCIASGIYSTGTTFHDLMLVVNAAGGGGSISCIQKPGRLAEIRPGKKCGVFIDFMFEAPNQLADLQAGKKPWQCMISDSWARYNVYKSKGYELHIADNFEHLIKLFRNHCI